MKRVLVRIMACAALGLVVPAAFAQYKWQTQDGGIVYSDLPPPPGVKMISDRQGRPSVQSGEPELPFPVKAAMDRYPVTLYTVPDCPPCKQGRDLLAQRGVPFSEKSIATANDLEAFKTLGFNDAGFPALSVGNDRSSGFEGGAWTRLLDAAGYPKSSMLPAGFKRAEARALTEPPANKVNVSVREAPPDGAPREGAASAIERYRKAVQQDMENQKRADQPAIRF